MIQRIFVIALGALTLAACAAPKTIPFNVEQVGSMQDRKLVAVTQDAPFFMPMRASRAGLGGLGAAVMINEGRTYAAEYGIVDPSAVIETHIQQTLKTRYSAQTAEPLNLIGAPAGTPYPTSAESLYVDAKVYNWGYSYFPLNWDRFRVSYGVIIHLVDGSSGTVVGQYNCLKYSHDDASTAPTLDALLADRSTLMNSTLRGLAEACAAEFDVAVLGAAPAA